MVVITKRGSECPICYGEGYTQLPYIDDKGNVKHTQIFCQACQGVGRLEGDRHGRNRKTRQVQGMSR